jgi:hypothetical protein
MDAGRAGFERFLSPQAHAEGVLEAVVDDCLEEDVPKPCIIKALTKQAQKESKEEQVANGVKLDVGSLAGMKVSMLKKLASLARSLFCI